MYKYLIFFSLLVVSVRLKRHENGKIIMQNWTKYDAINNGSVHDKNLLIPQEKK